MSHSIRSLTLAGLLAAGGLLLDTGSARAQYIGGQGITIGRPGGLNVTVGNGAPGYGYGGYGGYGNYGGWGAAPSYHAPGAYTYGRGYSGYAAPAWNGYGYAPGYSTRTYRVAPGVSYSPSGYNYGYGAPAYGPRFYAPGRSGHRRW